MHPADGRPLQSACAFLLSAMLICALGCQTQTDAVAAAQQMAATSSTLAAYYDAVDGLLEKSEEAQTAQTYISGVPFDAVALAQIDETRSEIRKRAAMAANVARLSALFADITNKGVADDAAKAADDLNTELGSIKAITTDTTETEALKVAVHAVMGVVKAKDEVKAAKLIKPVAASLSTFFDAEADTYRSLTDTYYITASSNAIALIGRDQVATRSLYESSLQPFRMEPDITDAKLKQGARMDLRARVQERLAGKRRHDKVVVTELGDSLHVMRDRIANVADHKAMRATLPPLTLEGVKAWIGEVAADLGEKI